MQKRLSEIKERLERATPGPCLDAETDWVSAKGYANFKVEGKIWKAHRWAYEQTRGTIPAGMQLDHLCRNKKCINPFHLEIVTNQENANRANAARNYKRPETSGTKNGRAKLSQEEVISIRADKESSSKALARKFKVSDFVIRQIRKERLWKNV